SALDWQSLPERLCSRTPASTVLYRTGHSVMNYSFAVVLCVSESVKDIFRLHACLQDSSLFPTLTDHNLALNNSRLRLGTSHENKVFRRHIQLDKPYKTTTRKNDFNTFTDRLLSILPLRRKESAAELRLLEERAPIAGVEAALAAGGGIVATDRDAAAGVSGAATAGVESGWCYWSRGSWYLK
ncbi:hypothetical protein J6590_033383, partial [Homalodisca vitripennis]